MKAVFASAVLLCLALDGAARAETVLEPVIDCTLSGTAEPMTRECKALQAAMLQKISDCMAARKAALELQGGTALPDNAHSSRARHLLCAAETRQAMGLVTN